LKTLTHIAILALIGVVPNNTVAAPEKTTSATPDAAKKNTRAGRSARSPCSAARRLAKDAPKAKKAASRAIATIASTNTACKLLLKTLGAPKAPPSKRPKASAFRRGKRTGHLDRMNGPCSRAMKFARTKADESALARMREINASRRKARRQCRKLLVSLQSRGQN